MILSLYVNKAQFISINTTNMKQNTQVIGIGTDILAIDRIGASADKYKGKFLDKLFTKEEQEYCHKYKDSIPRFAGRFCAKEAIAKAFGCGFGEDLGFLDISILNNNNGKPEVILSKKILQKFGKVSVLLSISHCKEYATASAIVLQEM